MSAEIIDVSGDVITVRIAGVLAEAALIDLQKATADVIRRLGKVRLLVLAEGFTGWASGGAWNDFSFQQNYDSCIEGMAIVGDRRWEDLALIFAGKDLRSFPIEYFTPNESDKLRAWRNAEDRTGQRGDN